MVINMPHDAVGGRAVPLVASPLRLSGTPVSYRHTPPVLGADTEDVLRSVLLMDDKELAALREQQII
jgi:crotonobetainyl-CoA:carnitine CoA-transferase CaiB-like acyl-CoA transferase